MRDVNSETFVKNVKRLNHPEDDWSDIVSDIMDDKMEEFIRDRIDEASRMDADDGASGVSNDTPEEDIEQDGGWGSVDTGF